MASDWNNYAMAGLGAVFVVFGLNILADDVIFNAKAPEQAGYAIEGAPAEAETAAAAPEGAPDITAMLASADASAGEGVFKKCTACHNIEKGGANKVGPALYGVMGRDIASVAGFGYSNALVAYGEAKQWDWSEMNGFLYKPKAHVKGTSMGFAGIKKDEDRANLIAYLNTQSDAPLAAPSSESAAVPAPAEGEAKTDPTASGTDAAEPAVVKATDAEAAVEKEGTAADPQDTGPQGQPAIENTEAEAGERPQAD